VQESRSHYLTRPILSLVIKDLSFFGIITYMKNQSTLQPPASTPLNIAWLLGSVSSLIYALVPTKVLDGIFDPATILFVASFGIVIALILGLHGWQQQKRLGAEKPTVPSLWVWWIAVPIFLITLGFIVFGIYNIVA